MNRFLIFVKLKDKTQRIYYTLTDNIYRTVGKFVLLEFLDIDEIYIRKYEDYHKFLNKETDKVYVYLEPKGQYE